MESRILLSRSFNLTGTRPRGWTLLFWRGNSFSHASTQLRRARWHQGSHLLAAAHCCCCCWRSDTMWAGSPVVPTQLPALQRAANRAHCSDSGTAERQTTTQMCCFTLYHRLSGSVSSLFFSITAIYGQRYCLGCSKWFHLATPGPKRCWCSGGQCVDHDPRADGVSLKKIAVSLSSTPTFGSWLTVWDLFLSKTRFDCTGPS